MDKDYAQTFQDKLLHWFDINRRILPWREEATPYKVWISEIMLQQTQVGTVVPYFLRFMEEIPHVFALANVAEDKLLKLWEGLGYYSRAKNLKKAAGIILTEYGGKLPSQVDELQSLPGIGPYTAGAIASMAFGQKATAVDGNVLRIIARITANTGDIKNTVVKREIGEVVEELISEDRPGDFNQALMDLGAMVCIPRGEPKCGDCPLSDLCEGHGQGIAETLPVKSPAKKRTVEEKTVFVLNFHGKIGLRKRPSKGLLSNLWEYPNVEGFVTEKEVRPLMKSWGLFTKSIRKLSDSKHLFSHKEWKMKGYYLDVEVTDFDDELTWTSKVEIAEKYSVPTAFKAYTDALNKMESNSCKAI